MSKIPAAILMGGALALTMVTPAVAQSGTELPNDVTCVFEAVGPEMQENAQFLIFVLMRSGRSLDDSAEVEEELEAIIALAHDQCIDLYPWASGESANAQLYAYLRIFGGALSDALRERGDDPDAIDAYFDGNLSRFGKATRLSATEKSRLRTHLEELGWDLTKPGLADMAENRLEIAMALNQLNRGFRLNKFY